nr:MAG TPA: hypothetical protein [Caudoviricetes sp.]
MSSFLFGHDLRLCSRYSRPWPSVMSIFFIRQ